MSFRDPSLLEWEVHHCSWGPVIEGSCKVYEGKHQLENRFVSCAFASEKRRALEAQMTPTPGAFVCSKACEHRFLWMTNLMYSRELVVKLRRMLTWYFAARVGVRSHAWKQCRFVLFRQSRVGRFSIIHQVHDHPTKNHAEACVIWENSGVRACGGICDLVYRDRYIHKKHYSCDVVPEDASSIASRHSRVLFLRSASNGNAWQELKRRYSWISELRLEDLKTVTVYFWTFQEDGTPHKVTLSSSTLLELLAFLAVLILGELL